MKIISDPICQCNKGNEDLNHIFWQCELYDDERQELIRQLRKIKLYLPQRIETIVTNPELKTCQCIISFLKKCNLNI